MKKTKKLENAVVEVSSNPSPIKFKITNLRTNAYPNALVKSDYHGYEIGDYISKGSENTIYQITEMKREGITESEISAYNQKLHRYGNTSDKKLSDLLVDYKKNGNFGVCYIGMKPIARGGKRVAKGKTVFFSEIDHSSPISYRRCYHKLDVKSAVSTKDYQIRSLSNKI